MQIEITINYWACTVGQVKEYLGYYDDLPSDFIKRLDLKDSEGRCYTEKFKTMDEAVEFCLKIYPELIVKPDAITFYTRYVE